MTRENTTEEIKAEKLIEFNSSGIAIPATTTYRTEGNRNNQLIDIDEIHRFTSSSLLLQLACIAQIATDHPSDKYSQTEDLTGDDTCEL